MLRAALTLLLLATLEAQAGPWFEGEPDFADAASRALAGDLLAAHGGMEALQAAKSIEFNFFTKMIGNPTPFYSFETLDLETGNAYVDWPFWEATIAWNGEEAWTRKWPMPLPGGFFVRLTSSFLLLPWQIHTDQARIGPVSRDFLPEDDTEYEVLRVTYASQNPGIPGTFYEIFVHPETRHMSGLKFDISHPGMVANPNQPLGPNYHVFGDYREFNGLVVPTFYKSYGQGGQAGKSNAYHFVWNLRTDQVFDAARLDRPADGEIDAVSTRWWTSENQSEQGASR